MARLDLPADLRQRFDAAGLVALRSTVARHADLLGLADGPLNDLVLVAHELATNATRYGGGGGELRMWRADDRVWCQVSDSGPGLADPAGAGLRRPDPGETGGRGLWLVRQMSDEMTIASDANGTTVTVAMVLSATAPPTDG